LDKNIKYQIEALVVSVITGKQPTQIINVLNNNHLNNLQLADSEFNIPAPIDLLIGADLNYQITTGSSSSCPTIIEFKWKQKVTTTH